jgi:hypothetical protein
VAESLARAAAQPLLGFLFVELHARSFALMGLLGAFNPGCTGDDVTAIQEIGSVTVSVSGGCPRNAEAVIVAGIGSCDDVLPALVERDGAEFQVSLLARRTEGACIAILESYEAAVFLGDALAPGPYRVTVAGELNQVTTDFAVGDCL